MSFENLNLNTNIIKALNACGFKEATEIQREAVPVVLEGRDLMASAQTGTGKTAAFVLPALEKLAKPAKKKGCGPRVLVLTPTRELAKQVSDNVKALGRFSRVFAGNVVGGEPYPPQIRMLTKGVDILVATPGRFLDHMERDRIDFSRIEMLILDEADRMLDMGFVDEVNTIANACPKDRQTLLFSATLEGKVMSVARRLLNDPARIQLVAKMSHHESIKQHVHIADNIRHKHRLLNHFIDLKDLSQAVIFTSTKRGADELARTLADNGHAAASLHGDMGQNQRRRTVDRMRRGQFRLLVATDVAARGLDIKGISHVINFDLPMVAEDYIHRIGRTGRGGAKGTAISFVGPDDWGKLSGIERLTGDKLNRSVVEGMEPTISEPQRKRYGKGKPGGGRGRSNSKGNWNKNGGGKWQSKGKGGQNPRGNNRGERRASA